MKELEGAFNFQQGLGFSGYCETSRYWEDKIQLTIKGVSIEQQTMVYKDQARTSKLLQSLTMTTQMYLVLMTRVTTIQDTRRQWLRRCAPKMSIRLQPTPNKASNTANLMMGPIHTSLSSHSLKMGNVYSYFSSQFILVNRSCKEPSRRYHNHGEGLLLVESAK